MHVLGGGFSQRRKSSKRPRDLHIRKVSFSGSSLSSLASNDSSASSRTFGGHSHADSAIALDPLQLHPTFSAAPPRLSERPYIKNRPAASPRWEEAVSYFDDDSTDDESYDDESELADDDDQSQEHHHHHQQGGDMLPPHASPADHAQLDTQQPQDYFLQQLAKRPPMPRSRWSESTVHSIESLASTSTLATPVPVAGIPNFSYKRAAVTRRPTLKTDPADDFMKRGGWKRRGIVFQNDEARSEDVEEQREYDFAG
ncbi:hypothetical protein B0I35DRAFT_433872 [Stachybotrys elegans]|uniref:Uncharacterized protein n=1 Tax=Stachybotrys elegans TaxID=80388 RepID=A0A8K0STJ1_9HYPO|nr:hypothetical protein B0I35DRAFT_433872 [Stachybotrys elegans]